MLVAGKDRTKSRLLIPNPKTILLTLKNDASPWQQDHPPLINPFISATPTARIIASFLLRHAGSSCTLTFRPGTEQLFILPICSAQHGNGIEDAHAHGWLPWPLEHDIRVHPLELTAFQHGHVHNDLWRTTHQFHTQIQQHPLYLSVTHPVDEKANKVPSDFIPECFTQLPWSTISPTRKNGHTPVVVVNKYQTHHSHLRHKTHPRIGSMNHPRPHSTAHHIEPLPKQSKTTPVPLHTNARPMKVQLQTSGYGKVEEPTTLPPSSLLSHILPQPLTSPI